MEAERDTAVLRHGPETCAALSNTLTAGRRTADVPQLVRGYGLVKAAAAQANRELGVLPPDVADAVVAAALDVASNRHDSAFPLPIVQGGGGTSLNMNANEVIASLATARLGRDVHANDHVNRSQSTNDTYPTAMALALLDLVDGAAAALDGLSQLLSDKAEQHGALQRLGRTCLQDAVPLTVGQTHRAQAHALARAASGLRGAAAALTSPPLGGTAVGTGIGAPPGFAAVAVRHLAHLAGRPLVPADDPFDAMAHLDAYSELASAGARAAIILGKIASDLRLLSSGPVGGLGEVRLPAVQKGSSIMPGKVNPVIPELVMQVAFQARGAAVTVDLAVAAGELELNVMEPVVLDALVGQLTSLAEVTDLFGARCLAGLEWDEHRLAQNLRGSLGQLVLLAGERGYDAASAAAGSATP